MSFFLIYSHSFLPFSEVLELQTCPFPDVVYLPRFFLLLPFFVTGYPEFIPNLLLICPQDFFQTGGLLCFSPFLGMSGFFLGALSSSSPLLEMFYFLRC